MKTLSVGFTALVLMAVLVSSPAHALLVGDGYEDSIVFRFWEVADYPTNTGCTFSLPIGGCVWFVPVELDPSLSGTLKLEVFDEPHIANLDPVATLTILFRRLDVWGIGTASRDDTLLRDGDGALRFTVTGGVVDLQQAWYVENYDGRHLVAYWDSSVIPPVPHPVPSPVPEPSTLLLLASGLAGLGGMAWRRHRRG